MTSKPASCLLDVKVTPRSSKNEIKVTDDGSIKVWVTSPPTDDQANTAVCRLVAERLALPKSSVTIKSGHSSRSKRLSCLGIELSVALDRLK